jgi:hypothetical protein
LPSDGRIFCEQTLVTFKGLAADTRFDGLEPLIEVLIQPNLGTISLDIGPQFIDLLSEKLLRLAKRAMNSAVVVTALLSPEIATHRDANHPGVLANSDDLT